MRILQGIRVPEDGRMVELSDTDTNDKAIGYAYVAVLEGNGANQVVIYLNKHKYSVDTHTGFRAICYRWRYLKTTRK